MWLTFKRVPSLSILFDLSSYYFYDCMYLFNFLTLLASKITKCKSLCFFVYFHSIGVQIGPSPSTGNLAHIKQLCFSIGMAQSKFIKKGRVRKADLFIKCLIIESVHAYISFGLYPHPLSFQSAVIYV